MSGVEIFKMFESDLSDMVFKAFGAILLHFMVEKLNQGVILQKKKKKNVEG
jgi:hypothetical protein